jgi:hypothetical protein
VAPLRRYFRQDFQRDVGARSGITPGNVIAANLNADGVSFSITRTTNQGVTTTLFKKVLWGMGNGGVLSDANPSGDTVTIFSNDDPACAASVDTAAFLNTLS